MSSRTIVEGGWGYGFFFFFGVSGDLLCGAVDQDLSPRQFPPPMAPRFSSRDLHQRRGPLVFHGKRRIRHPLPQNAPSWLKRSLVARPYSAEMRFAECRRLQCSMSNFELRSL